MITALDVVQDMRADLEHKRESEFPQQRASGGQQTDFSKPSGAKYEG